MGISPETFEELVADALDLIPDDLRRLIDNVEITIEEEPTRRILLELGMPGTDTLYGLYQGTPLTERGTDYTALPDRIVIYRKPLMGDFPRRDDLRHEVARTVIHELAHHFGIDDHRLEELGWD